MPDLTIEMWADGSCPASGGPGGYAAVLLAVRHDGEVARRRDVVGNERRLSNNRAELLAVIRGLEAFSRPTRVKVITDSRYVIGGFQQRWVADWKANGWRRRSVSAKDRSIKEAMKAGATMYQCPVCQTVTEADTCIFHTMPVAMHTEVDVKLARNRDLWEQLEHLVDQHDISWRHVSGHTGVFYNEEADRLAGEQTQIAKAALEGASV